jgi:hypothetical protein
MRTGVPTAARPTRMPGRAHCRIISLITGRQKVTHFMKPKIEKRTESGMKYFKPELYLRYNSRDDATADRADREWEQAIQTYKKHLSKFSKEMNEHINVKELAENLCLHDAQLISSRGFISARPFQQAVRTWILSLRSNGNIINIVYFLWGEAQVSTAQNKWPFSKLFTHWLYDEVDLEQGSPFHYWHRILLSDGSVISIPFLDVFVDSFAEQNSETAMNLTGRIQPTPTPALEKPRRQIVSRKDRKKIGLR